MLKNSLTALFALTIVLTLVPQMVVAQSEVVLETTDPLAGADVQVVEL